MSHDDDSGLSLTAEMVEMRAQGETYARIADEMDMSAPEVHQRVQAYLRDEYGPLSIVEQRMLQMRRLERLLGALETQVMGGDHLSEGKHTKNYLEVLNQITELMDLKRDRLRDEQVELTRAQTRMIYEVMAGVRAQVQARVLTELRQLPASGDPEAVVVLAVNRIESRFPDIFADVVAAASAELEQGKSTTVRLGGAKGDEDG